MTERTPERSKWWKAFLPKKKSGGPKETIDADFDPFPQRPENPKDPPAASKTTSDQSVPQLESSNGSGVLSEDTYDDSQLESVFNEQTCRRNMKVSRSGRFKEKRRVRSSLPRDEKDTDNRT